MSVQNEESLMDHLDGIGIGAFLLIVGLVMTIGGVGPGIMVGLPLILLGLVVPLGMTYNAQTESASSGAT